MSTSEVLYTEQSLERYILKILEEAVVFEKHPNFELENPTKSEPVLGGWFHKAKSSAAPFKPRKNAKPAFFRLNDKLQLMMHDADMVQGKAREGTQIKLTRSRIAQPFPYKQVVFALVRVLEEPYTVFAHIDSKSGSVILTPEDPEDTMLVCRFIAAVRYRTNGFDNAMLLKKHRAAAAAIKIQAFARRIYAQKLAQRIRSNRNFILYPAFKAIGIDQDTSTKDVVNAASRSLGGVGRGVKRGLGAGSRISAAIAADLLQLGRNSVSGSTATDDV